MAKITIEFDTSESDKVIRTLRKMQRLFNGSATQPTTKHMVADATTKISQPQSIWSRKFDKCIVHGGTDSPHASHGMCQRCNAKYHGVPPKKDEQWKNPDSPHASTPALNIVWKEGECSNTECPYIRSDYMGMPVVMGRSGQYYCSEECRLVSADSPI